MNSTCLCIGTLFFLQIPQRSHHLEDSDGSENNHDSPSVCHDDLTLARDFNSGFTSSMYRHLLHTSSLGSAQKARAKGKAI
jgi:hypothetical protein